jgi:hypothetical protein
MSADRRFDLAAAIGSAVVIAAGVLFFGWSTVTVLAFYWIENVIIGVFNLVRMGVAAARSERPFNGLFLCVFFSIHYGLFCLAHAYFITSIFGADRVDDRFMFDPALALFARTGSDAMGTVALLAMVVSAGMETVQWLMNADGADRADPQRLMFAPYGRIVVLHIVLLGGGFLLQILHAPALAALLLVGAKLAYDVLRMRAAPSIAPGTAA